MKINEISRKLLQTLDAPLPSEKRKVSILLRRLDQVIAYHNTKYYRDDDPEISDSEYDQLKLLQKRLKNQWPDISSGEDKIPPDLTGRFAKTNHLVPMLSLENTTAVQGISDFVDKTETFAFIESRLQGIKHK